MTPEEIKETFINSNMSVDAYHDSLSDTDDVKLSKEDFIAMRDEQQAPLLTSILARTNERTDVVIKNTNGNNLNIEIRVMLTKAEVAKQSKFFNMMKHIQDVEDEYYYYLAGSFLALITTDSDLDVIFWRRDDIDPYIIQELIKAFTSNYE